LLGVLNAEKRADPTSTVPLQRAAPEPEWLLGLQADVHALGEQLRNVPRAASDRAPATTVHDDSAALQALLSRLEAQIALLESAAVTAHAAPAGGPPKLLERLDRDSQKFPWGPETGFVGDLDAWTNDLQKELTRSHKLWTLDQVLSIYGAPWSVQESNGIISQLEYPFRRLDDTTSLGLVFRFASERVVEAYVFAMDTSPR
jgi:hypothetical protein